MTNKIDFYTMQRKSEQEAEIYIYGPIVNEKWEEDEVTATEFKDNLKALGEVKVINLHINSGGGNVFGGHAIYNMLKQHRATVNVYIDALAASIASVIAMAGDTIFMHENSMMMIHNSWMPTIGNSKELREQADLMDKLDKVSNTAYLNKNKKITPEKLEELLEDDFWMTAEEAVELGFADEIIGVSQVAASITSKQADFYRNVPDSVAKDTEKVTDVKGIELQDSRRDYRAIVEHNRLMAGSVDDFLLPKKQLLRGGHY